MAGVISTDLSGSPSAFIVNEEDNIVELAQQEYYKFLTSKTSSSLESDLAKIEALKRRMAAMENIHRQMVKRRANKKELKQIQKQEEREILQKEKIRQAKLKALREEKNRAYEEKVRRRNLLEKDHKSLTPAGLAISESCWVRGNIADVISLVEVRWGLHSLHLR